jgi:hypothetical protein
VFPDEDQHTELNKIGWRSDLSQSPIEVVIEIRSTFNAWVKKGFGSGARSISSNL